VRELIDRYSAFAGKNVTTEIFTKEVAQKNLASIKNIPGSTKMNMLLEGIIQKGQAGVGNTPEAINALLQADNINKEIEQLPYIVAKELAAKYPGKLPRDFNDQRLALTEAKTKELRQKGENLAEAYLQQDQPAFESLKGVPSDVPFLDEKTGKKMMKTKNGLKELKG
jgi:hypothetical protein